MSFKASLLSLESSKLRCFLRFRCGLLSPFDEAFGAAESAEARNLVCGNSSHG